MLTNCHDTDGIASLAYNPGRQDLQNAAGFRNHARNNALAIGITGYILRYRHKDVRMVMEGTIEQVGQFNHWLHQCYGQGMFNRYLVHSQTPILLRSYSTFSIYFDHTRPYHPMAHPNGIIRGTWSDNINEKLSDYSANLYQGGGSRSYPRRDSDKDSGDRRVLRSSSLMSAGTNAIGLKRKKL